MPVRTASTSGRAIACVIKPAKSSWSTGSRLNTSWGAGAPTKTGQGGKRDVERLTIRNGDGSVSQPTSTTVEAVFERLALYEDTGFTPADVRDMRNELCLRCGKYKEAYLGACDGCRFKR